MCVLLNAYEACFVCKAYLNTILSLIIMFLPQFSAWWYWMHFCRTHRHHLHLLNIIVSTSGHVWRWCRVNAIQKRCEIIINILKRDWKDSLYMFAKIHLRTMNPWMNMGMNWESWIGCVEWWMNVNKHIIVFPLLLSLIHVNVLIIFCQSSL